MQPLDTSEMFNSALLPAGRFGGEVVQTLNPITTEMSTLRPSLLPGMLKVMGHNQNHGQTSLRLFEFGRVHTKRKTGLSLVGDYTEVETLLIASSGEWVAGSWHGPAREVDAYDLQGVVNRVLTAIGLGEARFVESDGDALAAYGADVLIGKRWVGSILRVADSVADQSDLRQAAFVAELDFTALCGLAANQLRPRFEAISRFPIVERDIAVVVAASQPAGPMLTAIRQAGGPLLKSVKVFDVYEGEHVGEDQKSLAFGLRMGADRTLRDKEVDKVVSKILSALEREFGAKLRG